MRKLLTLALIIWSTLAIASTTCSTTITPPSCPGFGSVCVNLSWTASTGVAGYNIYKGTTSGGEGTTPINTSLVTSVTYQDNSVTAGTQYFYVVVAVTSGGQTSATSNEACAQTSTPPPPPTNLVANP